MSTLNVDITVGVTSALAALLKQQPEKYEWVKAMIEHYIEEYKIMSEEVGYNRLSLAHSFNMSMDQIIERGRAGADRPISCKAGCSHCCYMEVDITYDEALLLRYGAMVNGIEIDWARARHQASPAKWRQLDHKDRKCVFLSDKGECGVYDYRPMGCRKYLVASPPEKCDSKKYPKGDVEVLNIHEAEAIASAIYSTVETGWLPRMLLATEAKK